MTNPDLTYIQAIIDRSGSMQSIREDAEGGFNSFIADQRALPGQCRVSLAQFDNEYEVVYRDLPIDEVPPLVIVPRGSTAMLDAIGRTVHDLGARLAALPEAERPGTVIVGVVTDGMENSSREFNYQMVHELITTQEQQYSWTFMYMGADQDAIEQGSKMGINADRAMTYGRGRTGDAYLALSASVGRLRSAVMDGLAPAQARPAAAFTDEERAKASD